MKNGSFSQLDAWRNVAQEGHSRWTFMSCFGFDFGLHIYGTSWAGIRLRHKEVFLWSIFVIDRSGWSLRSRRKPQTRTTWAKNPADRSKILKTMIARNRRFLREWWDRAGVWGAVTQSDLLGNYETKCVFDSDRWGGPLGRVQPGRKRRWAFNNATYLSDEHHAAVKRLKQYIWNSSLIHTIQFTHNSVYN